VRPAGTHTHTLQINDHGSKAGSTQLRTRRGTPAGGAPLVAGPRPWRAGVRPAGACAHHHLQQDTHGTKAGSRLSITSPPAAARPETRRGGKGDPAHRAGGATRVRRGARRRGAGCSPALPADLHGPKLGGSTGSSRLGVATAPDSRRHGTTRRRPWGGGGAARPACSGSKARTQAG
jgi:hypothetical protein